MKKMSFSGIKNRQVKWRRVSLMACVMMATTVVTGVAGFLLGEMHAVAQVSITRQMVSDWRNALLEQEQEIDVQREQLDSSITLLAAKVAEVQARAVRLDALGERLASSANFDKGEFSFHTPPALGGPDVSMPGVGTSLFELEASLDTLSSHLNSQERQLAIMETLLNNRELSSEGYVAGRPVKKGWVSSRYGHRIDPFKGKKRWHKGVDFAGPEGSDIIAVASGVVTWSDSKPGYGQMVEINHGNGYITRYAHNKAHLVAVGDLVKKGQTIAKMGSSGRATGPHVHFEVYKHGRVVDPAVYINRTDR